MKKLLLCISVLITISVALSGQCSTTSLSQSYPNAFKFASVSESGRGPDSAFDFGTSAATTRWRSNGQGGYQFIGLEFPDAINLCEVIMTFGANEYPTYFSIRASNDWSNWTPLATISDNGSNSITIDTISNTGAFKIFQLDLYSASGSSGYGLYNFILHAKAVNTPPLVSITSPINNMQFMIGNDITINATASDPDVNGFIKKVQFYHADTLIGTDSTAPYSIVWSGAPVGNYGLKAKATDNLNGTTLSSAINISVTNAPAFLRNWILTGNNLSNTNSGYVSIGGTITHLPSDTTALKLAVKGTIFAKKLTVTEALWSDYVFDRDYKLRSLSEVENFILKNKHLPEVPSTAEVNANGINVGENQAVLLKKIEELTLYVIKLNKEVTMLKKQIKRKAAVEKRS